jgi:predicted dehydrogenase
MQNYLIIGAGSMGKRRIRCLLACGVGPEQIVVFDARRDRLDESRAKYGVRVTEDHQAHLADPNVAAVFVAVPAYWHLEYCAAAVRAGKHWFCEAPLAVSLEGIDALVAETRERALIGACGCQLRFHPLACALVRWREDAGPVLAGSYSVGTYLPEWHPYEDYRRYYVCDAAQGGGNVDLIGLDVSWIRWIVGRQIEAVTCRSSKTGELELTAGTPDHHEIILEFAGGLMLSLHFDAVDHTHERWLRLATDKSTAKWSSHDSCVRVFDAAAKSWRTIDPPPGYDYEQCYHAEIGHFLECIAARTEWPFPFEAAAEAVRVLLATRESSQRERTVRLAEVGPPRV